MQPSSSQEMMATCESATVTVNTNHSEPKPTSECKLTGPTWLWQVSVTIDPDGPGPQSAVNVPYQDVLYQVDTSIPLPSPPSTSSSLAFDFHPHGIGCWSITYEVTGSWDGSDDCNGCRDDCPDCGPIKKSGSVSFMVVALNEVKITQPEAGELIWVDDEVTLEAIFKPDGVQAPSDIAWSVPVKPTDSNAKTSPAGPPPAEPSSVGTSPPENNYQGSKVNITPDKSGEYIIITNWRCDPTKQIKFIAYEISITGIDQGNKSVIGKKNSYTVSVTPNLKLATYLWSIGNPYQFTSIDLGTLKPIIVDSHIKNYTLSSATFSSITQSTGIETLSLEDYEKQTIDFYWIKPATQVSVKISVDGLGMTRSKTKDVKVDVLGPTEVKFDPVAQSDDKEIKYVPRLLRYGESGIKHAIKYDAKLTAPFGYKGRVGIIQLVNHEYNRVIEAYDESNPALSRWKYIETFTTKDNFFLDRAPVDSKTLLPNTTPMFGNKNSPVNAGSNCTISGIQDNPDIEVDTVDLVAVNRKESFKSHFMWRPDGDDSIWIAVQRMTWGWAGVAVNQDTVGNGKRDGVWTAIEKRVESHTKTQIHELLYWDAHLQTEEANKNPIYWKGESEHEWNKPAYPKGR